MKKETQQLHGNIGNYGGGVFASERKWAWGPKMASKHLPRRKKTTGGLENGLANPWKRKNITKKAHAGRGLETIWEMSNYIIKAMSRTVDVENSVARFQYTNSDAQEEVKIGSGGILARFLTKSNDGYYVSITCVGGGSMLRFTEMKNDLMNGLLVGFEDSHAQGTAWDYRLADFSNSHLTEYRQYTNGMVFGKFLAWNSRNSDLILEADFKKPYDFEKHRVDLRILQQRSQ